MSLFQSNLRKQIRNLPKILNFVKIIHYYSKLFTGVPRRAASSSARSGARWAAVWAAVWAAGRAAGSVAASGGFRGSRAGAVREANE